ncbi:MAG: carbonic anhydrase [Gemmatimonadaceae bacterium]
MTSRHDPTDRSPWSRSMGRRHFLHTWGLAGIAALGPTQVPFVVRDEVPARREPLTPDEPATPQEALATLVEGNARFVEGRIIAPRRNMERLKEVAPKQKPFAAFLGCADSRVPIEIVFDQGFGDLFVVRDAGNVISPEVTASLEFGTLVLGAQVLFVLGHSGCGAVSATLKGDAVPGQISALYARIQPAVDVSHGDLDETIANNVKIQANILRRSSPVIRDLVDRGRLLIAGGVYDLQSGRVRVLDL